MRKIYKILKTPCDIKVFFLCIVPVLLGTMQYYAVYITLTKIYFHCSF